MIHKVLGIDLTANLFKQKQSLKLQRGTKRIFMGCKPQGIKIKVSDFVKSKQNKILMLEKKKKRNIRKIRFILFKLNKPRLSNLYGRMKLEEHEIWLSYRVPKEIQNFFFWNYPTSEIDDEIQKLNQEIKMAGIIQDDFMYVDLDTSNEVFKFLVRN